MLRCIRSAAEGEAAVGKMMRAIAAGPADRRIDDCSRFGSHTEKQIAIAMSVTKAARQPTIPMVRT
jgi:hypothetical protein